MLAGIKEKVGQGRESMPPGNPVKGGKNGHTVRKKDGEVHYRASTNTGKVEKIWKGKETSS